jgi:CRP/FNR family transcriptional regulator, cyclic AMP receptor protein
MRTICDILSGQAFFKDLTAEQMSRLSENAKYRRFRANELVFHHGNLANRFYVLVNGKVALEATAGDGHLVRCQTAGAGELLGWSWMFSSSIRQLQGRALEPTEAIYFCGDSLRQLCDQDHDLGYELFRRVAEVMMQRLQATRQLLLERPLPAPAEDLEWRPGEPQAALAAHSGVPATAV